MLTTLLLLIQPYTISATIPIQYGVEANPIGDCYDTSIRYAFSNRLPLVVYVGSLPGYPIPRFPEAVYVSVKQLPGYAFGDTVIAFPSEKIQWMEWKATLRDTTVEDIHKWLNAYYFPVVQQKRIDDDCPT